MDIQQFERATEIRKEIEELQDELAKIKKAADSDDVLSLQLRSDFGNIAIDLKMAFMPLIPTLFMKEYCLNISYKISKLETEMKEL